MRASVTERFGTFIMLGALIILWPDLRVEAQVVIAEHEQETLGSVQVGNYAVLVKIAYQSDSALLAVAVPGSDGSSRYIPLIGSTYRGVSSFQLDLLSPDFNDEIWVWTSWPQRELLAYYRFGSETALTRFGRVKLLEMPFPQYLSGAPVRFPKEGAEIPRLRASFFHYDDM